MGVTICLQAAPRSATISGSSRGTERRGNTSKREVRTPMSDLESTERPDGCEPDAPSLIETPPHKIGGILGRLGPGVILAASIVGSGELIGTTKTGAQAGFWLLWLILIGCVIKVFAQVEFGRYSISSGKTTMTALDEVPGPRLRANWVLWYWLVMFLVSLGQLGGIVGGVGQSLAMNLHINGSLNRLLEEQKQWDARARVIRTLLDVEYAEALIGNHLEAHRTL